MSWLQTRTVTTFHALNPDWAITVYVPTAPSVSKAKYIPDYTGFDHFYAVKEMSFVEIVTVDFESYGINANIPDILRSDILRYDLLHEHGGVWSDFDVIWLKPMSHLSGIKTAGANVEDSGASVCFSRNTHGWNNIGVLMAMPGHKLYKDLISICKEKASKIAADTVLDHQEFGVAMLNRLFPTLDAVLEKYPDIVGFHYETFYPYSIEDMDRLWKRTDLTCLNENVMCVHWFNGHALSKSFVNGGPGNECSMTAIIDRQIVKAGAATAARQNQPTYGHRKHVVSYHERGTFFENTAKFFQPSERVLDLGCGIRPMSFFKPALHVMVDPYDEYVEMLRHQYAASPDIVVFKEEALSFSRTVPDKMFDSVFLLDVIEHMPKEVGQELIREIDRIARVQAVIFTPLGFHEQDSESEGIDGWGLSGASVQKHRSGWVPDDFPESWTFHICEDFHQFDWRGGPTPPFGAFFAIKTKDPQVDASLPLTELQKNALRFMPLLKPPGELVPSRIRGQSDILARLESLSHSILERYGKLEGELGKAQRVMGKVKGKLEKVEREVLELRNRPAGFRRLRKKLRKAFSRLFGSKNCW